MADETNIYLYQDKKEPEVRGTVFYDGRFEWCPWQAVITDALGVRIFKDSYRTLRGAQNQLGKNSRNGMKRIKVIKEV